MMRLIKFIIFFILFIYFLNKFNIYYYINNNLKINIIFIITFIIDLLQNFIEVINQNEITKSIDDLNNDSIENEEIKVFYKNKYFWFITGIVILSLLYYNSNINYITDNNIINNTTINIINTSNTLNNVNTVNNLLPLNDDILNIGDNLNNSLLRNEELIEELSALLNLFS